MSRPVPLASLPESVQERITGKPKRRSPRKSAQVPANRLDVVHEVATRFRLLCKAYGLPMPVPEYRFHASRRWRFDYCWPYEHVALEVDGGNFVQGAHVRGARILQTHEKLNHAAALGYRVLFTVPRRLCSDETLALVRQALTPSPSETK